MRKTGQIISIENGVAMVSIPRESACGGDCAGCPGCPVTDGARIRASCEIAARPGDRAVVDFPDAVALRSALLLYGAPLAAFFVGYAAASAFFPDEISRIFAGAAGVILAVVIGRIVDKHGSHDRIQVVEVIGKDKGCSDM